MENSGICIKHAPACDVEQNRERRTKISYTQPAPGGHKPVGSRLIHIIYMNL